MLVTAAAAQAQIHVVVPNQYASAEAPGSNYIPFSWLDDAHRYQQAYAASQFAALASPGFITEIAFRPDAEFGGIFVHTLPSVEIHLSTTSATPATLSATYGDNVGADDTVVSALGPLSISSAFTGPDVGPKDFDVVIPLDVPFPYDPNAGDLLLDIRIHDQGGTTVGAALDREQSQVVLFTGRVSCDMCSGDAETGVASGSGVVTRFTVPEVEGAGGGLAAFLTLLALVGKHAGARRGAGWLAAQPHQGRGRFGSTWQIVRSSTPDDTEPSANVERSARNADLLVSEILDARKSLVGRGDHPGSRRISWEQPGSRPRTGDCRPPARLLRSAPARGQPQPSAPAACPSPTRASRDFLEAHRVEERAGSRRA